MISPWEGGAKVYINGPGHMTKIAARPIYGKLGHLFILMDKTVTKSFIGENLQQMTQLTQ